MFNILNLFKKKQGNVMDEYIILNKDFDRGKHLNVRVPGQYRMAVEQQRQN